MKNPYDVLSDKVKEFFKETYEGPCVVKFYQSYDSKEWELVTIYIDTDSNGMIIFDYDFFEGQKYIRNIKICHIEDVLMPSEAKMDGGDKNG